MFIKPVVAALTALLKRDLMRTFKNSLASGIRNAPRVHSNCVESLAACLKFGHVLKVWPRVEIRSWLKDPNIYRFFLLGVSWNRVSKYLVSSTRQMVILVSSHQTMSGHRLVEML